jgi:hypothetical protein
MMTPEKGTAVCDASLPYRAVVDSGDKDQPIAGDKTFARTATMWQAEVVIAA